MSRPMHDTDDTLTEPEQFQFEREAKEDRADLVSRLRNSNDRAEIVELAGLIYGPATAKLAGEIYDEEVRQRAAWALRGAA